MTANLTDLQIILCLMLGVVYGCLLWQNGYSFRDRKKLFDGLLWGAVMANVWIVLCVLYNRWTGLIE
jgi:hypothetical protein